MIENERCAQGIIDFLSFFVIELARQQEAEAQREQEELEQQSAASEAERTVTEEVTEHTAEPEEEVHTEDEHDETLHDDDVVDEPKSVDQAKTETEGEYTEEEEGDEE